MTPATRDSSAEGGVDKDYIIIFLSIHSSSSMPSKYIQCVKDMGFMTQSIYHRDTSPEPFGLCVLCSKYLHTRATGTFILERPSLTVLPSHLHFWLSRKIQTCNRIPSVYIHSFESYMVLAISACFNLCPAWIADIPLHPRAAVNTHIYRI